MAKKKPEVKVLPAKGVPSTHSDDLWGPCGHVGTKVKGVEGLWGSAGGYKGLDLALERQGVPVLLLDESLLEWVICIEGPFTSLPVEQVGEGFRPFEVRKYRDFIYWPWPDRQAPRATKLVIETFVRLAKLPKLEVACIGGHGRTGTVLAILAALRAGWPTADAVNKLRGAYCNKAVESREQIRFVAEVLASIRGEEVPLESPLVDLPKIVALGGELANDTGGASSSKWTEGANYLYPQGKRKYPPY